MKKTCFSDERVDMVGEDIASYDVPAAVSGIWKAIQTLSPANRHWISEHLIEQEEDQRIDLISDEELAACYSVEEVGQRLRAMVHEHFANRTL